MSKKKPQIIQGIKLGKLIHGGQCLAEDESGKKVLVWGGLPSEIVDVRVIKKKSSYQEALVTDVIEASDSRLSANEPDSYLSTSPWQIMTFDLENQSKQLILEESFTREGLDNIIWSDFVSGGQEYGYRNKMEFGFWGDDDGLHLAHFKRGSKGKQKVDGSALASDSINEAAINVRDELNKHDLWGGDLKTLVLRASSGGEVVGALFVKDEAINLGDFSLPDSLKGVVVYYSNPQSPASVPTKKLYSFGDIKLTDTVMGVNITYDVLSFFQVNLEVFELALTDIANVIQANPSLKAVDMYSGVGTIGIPVGAEVLIESDESNIEYTRKNSEGTKAEVIHSLSENSTDYIDKEQLLIIDPPRAGLHASLVASINEKLPKVVVYLSCNPSTQARDVSLLKENYDISSARGFNFFPRTPHIESLVVMKRK